MKLEICIPDSSKYSIACSLFSSIPDITIFLNSIVNAKYPVMITAGNSFGEMNGGIDGIINTHLSAFTPDKYIQADVKGIIMANHYGELPVGQSILVRTAHPKHKYLIYTPTMRVAENVENTLNAYLALLGSLTLMCNANIPAASLPLFCAGAGGMLVRRACLQMIEAYNTIIGEQLINGDWPIYHEHHRKLLSC